MPRRAPIEPRYIREAQVEREVLLRVGRIPDLLLLKNETGYGHPHAVKHVLQTALKPWGPEAVATALSVLQRNTVTWGLGVGSPDLVGAVAGRAGGIELKRPVGGVLSEEQRRYHAAARRRGVFVATATSADEVEAAVARWRAGELE